MSTVLNRPPCNLYFDGDIHFDCDSPVSQDGGFGVLYKGAHDADGCVALKQLRIRGSSGDRRVRFDSLRLSYSGLIEIAALHERDAR